jgi:hypothetical protein
MIHLNRWSVFNLNRTKNTSWWKENPVICEDFGRIIANVYCTTSLRHIRLTDHRKTHLWTDVPQENLFAQVTCGATCMKNMNKFQNILGLLLLGLGKRDLCAQNIGSRTHIALQCVGGTPENDTFSPRKLQDL